MRLRISNNICAPTRAGLLTGRYAYRCNVPWVGPYLHPEEFTLAEFVEAFDPAKISLGGPVFDLEKLTWLNGKHIRELEPADLLARMRSEQLSDEYLLEVLPLAHERIDTLADFIAYAGFFFVGDCRPIRPRHCYFRLQLVLLGETC